MEQIRALKCFPLKDIGSLDWFANQEKITTLHQNISSEMKDGDVSVTARMIQEEEKTVVLLQELIALDEWKRSVLAEIKKDNLDQVFPIYSILFTESVLSSVLLSVLYSHENELVTIFDEEILAELMDHCVHHVITLIGITNKKSPIDVLPHSSDETLSNADRINRFELDLQYQVCNLLLSVLRLVIDHVEELSLGLLTRLVQHHDVAILLVHLIDNRAWTNRNMDGAEVKYNDTWTKLEPEERFILGKYEAQTWKMLLDLLLHPRCAELYEISTFRKNELLKLEKHLHEIVIDQFPALACFRQWFAQIKLTNGRNVAAKPLIFEMETNTIRAGLRRGDGNLSEMAEQATRMLNNVGYLREVAAKHSDVYVNFEKLCESRNVNGAPAGRKCSSCEGHAKFKCSRCKQVWYCDKNCQLKDWSEHKKQCSV